VVIGNELLKRKTELSNIAHASHFLGLAFARGKHRQQQGGKNGDNADDHQEFNQVETPGMNLP